jgi:4-alpha-glucanotransferase
LATEKTISELSAVETPNYTGVAMNTPNKKIASELVKASANVNGTFEHSSITKKTVTKKAGTKKDTNPKKVAVKAVEKKSDKNIKKTVVKSVKETVLNITFQLKFGTSYGQSIFLTANHPLFGNGNLDAALPLHFFNEEIWAVTLELPNHTSIKEDIVYNYFVRNADGTISYDWGKDKIINPSKYSGELLVIDSWNYAGYFENAFYTEPFQNVLLKANSIKSSIEKPKIVTHTFKVKAPLLAKGQTICLLGSNKEFGNWNTETPVVMERPEEVLYYSVNLNLSKSTFPIAYKYGVYDTINKRFVNFEDGNNRVIYDAVAKNKQTIVNDAFAVLPSTTWKGAGIAIPVFSLRTEQSFGVGEFTDLKKLVDWSKHVGLKMVQILPINDTTATHSNADSYPYAAISAFALHPIYLNLSKVVDKANKKLLDKLEKERIHLNNLSTVDYESVVKVKLNFIKKIFPSQAKETFESKDYQNYFNQNKHWLVPYAAFCYLRDEYGTAHYDEWPAFRNYNQDDIETLSAKGSKAFDDIAIHYFMQYHLHLQLKEATEYAHENGIIVKGDIAIGIYRYGTDAWQSPELYNMNVQAGAPPDDFAVKGQNWGFPTYNWQRMKDDGFTWWKQRFEQMGYYFDAFRIDHILGFFRIWSIPIHAVEGIMGNFVPAIPVHINEFNEKGIWFDYYRYTKPFINDNILWEAFEYDNEYVKNNFLNYDGYGNYTLKNEFNTQLQVEKYFANLEQNDFNKKIKQSLFNLISNVILFEVEGSQGQQFHFRFGIDTTSSFKSLDSNTQQQLSDLYVNYFFRRQDDFWMKEAIQKLPALKRTTNMLICGEDLGMVPTCLPDVMKQLGLLSLEIQRMPKDPKKQFFHPNDAPYLSVVTPSTHDMSTIRGWWEEDGVATQKFFNHELGQWGDAPQYCEAWINKAIVTQHLYSPAMWSVFQLQDLLGIDENIRRENPNDERINIPANPKHYWCYRMHLTLEELQQQDAFNTELKKSVQLSGR